MVKSAFAVVFVEAGVSQIQSHTTIYYVAIVSTECMGVILEQLLLCVMIFSIIMTLYKQIANYIMIMPTTVWLHTLLTLSTLSVSLAIETYREG